MRSAAPERRLDADEDAAADERAADEEGGEAAGRVQPVTISRKEKRASPPTLGSVVVRPSRLPMWQGAHQGSRDGRTTSPVESREGGVADAGSAESVNGSTAGTPRDRRNALQPNDLPLPGYDFASVYRSATSPNEVFQEGGSAKEQERAKRDRRKARRVG